MKFNKTYTFKNHFKILFKIKNHYFKTSKMDPMMQQHQIVNHDIQISYINMIINKYHNICNQINIGEESSWIPPTCFPASTDVSTIPIPFQYGISRYMGFIKYYPLLCGAIGSHPLYNAGNQLQVHK